MKEILLLKYPPEESIQVVPKTIERIKLLRRVFAVGFIKAPVWQYSCVLKVENEPLTRFWINCNAVVM